MILVKFYAEVFTRIPQAYPGSLVASAAYQDRMFAAKVKEATRRAVLSWRERLKALLEEVAAAYPPREPVDLTALADFLSTVVEGGSVLGRALDDPDLIVGQVMLMRQYLKLLFSPRQAIPTTADERG